MRLTLLPRTVLLALPVVLLGAFASSTPAGATELCHNEGVRMESNINPATKQPYDLGLPECRAYEMVSPLEKQAKGVLVEKPGGGPLVSPDGEAIGFYSTGAFAGTENLRVTGVRPDNNYIARRTSTGWLTESASAPASTISAPTIDLFEGEVSLDLVTRSTCGNVGIAGGGLAGSPSLACAIRDTSGAWAKTAAYATLNGSSSAAGVFGSSVDLTDVIWFTSASGLLPESEVPDGAGAIYETIGLGTASPQLRIVNVDSEGRVLGSEHGLSGPLLGNRRFAPSIEGSVYQAVSADGQTIYFEAEPAGGGPLTLYARTGDFGGGTPAASTTVTIAEGGTFAGASADGSKVFFTTQQKLASTDKDSGYDLYEYNFDAPAAHRYVQVSAGGLGDPAPGSGAEVQSGQITGNRVSGSVIGISSEGSHVYFSAQTMLTTLPNGNGEHAPITGGTYCYDTETSETKFVGTGVENGNAQLSPDGRYLLFTSSAHLSPEDKNSGTAVYRYDCQTGEVTWISHPAPGFSPVNEGDNATLPEREEFSFRDGASPFFPDARRAISDNGEYVIFTTGEKLQADDVNKAPDVYLWHDGEVHMISDGTNPVGVTEAPGMSATGSDVVFTTTSRLVGQDKDELRDVYDARTQGGFPAPAPEPACNGEECQGTTSPTATFSAPATATVTSGTNLSPGPTTFTEASATKTGPKLSCQEKARRISSAKKRSQALRRCRKAHTKKKPKQRK